MKEKVLRIIAHAGLTGVLFACATSAGILTEFVARLLLKMNKMPMIPDEAAGFLASVCGLGIVISYLFVEVLDR